VEFLANWVGQDDDEGEASGTNPKIDAQWLRGSVSALKPRSDRFATEVAIEEDNLAELGLLGRPVQVGSEWSVIVAACERGFEVWGTIEAATDYAVLPSYRLLAGSPLTARERRVLLISRRCRSLKTLWRIGDIGWRFVALA
jgi:hypothetical protein